MTVNFTTLPNGLRVVSHHIPTVETVTLGTWVDVGARHETPEINGIAHMLEHMAFKGTKTRTAKAIAEEIESVGGFLNAYTSREVTAYHARVLKEQAPLALDIVADILQNSTFDATEFKREQGVVLQEIGQSQDTPDDIVFDYFQEVCFPDHPLGRPILGTAEIIRGFTPDDVRQFMGKNYGTHQMIVGAAGNITHDQLLDLVQQKFTSVPEDRVVDMPTVQYKGGDSRTQRDLEQVHVLMGFQGVSYTDPAYYAASTFATILGGGMSSRLFQEIREKQGLVYSIYAYHSSYRDTGVFGVYAGTGPSEVAQLMPSVCKELKQLPSTLTDQELNRAKAQMRSSILMSLESTSGRCSQITNQVLFRGRPLPKEEIIDRIEAVDRQDLEAFADTILTSTPTLTTLGPIENVPSYETFKKALAT